MGAVGLRELRQQASELVRQAQAGQEVTITVAGRPAARLVPIGRRTWHGWADVAELFTGPPDSAWARDREALDQSLHSPVNKAATP